MTSSPQPMKVLIVGLDGVRPEQICEDLTPNVLAFAKRGVRFLDNRASYPTETYPNVACLVTGTPPGVHGIVANEFLLPSHDACKTWLGADLDRVESWNQDFGGRFHSVPTLGDILGTAGKTFWSISTEMPGSARLKHPTADRYPGHICVMVKAFERSRPAGIADILAELAGPLPPRMPAALHLADQTYVTDSFMALERTRGVPDAAILWYGGPDHSMHVHGLGAEETRRMLRHVDAEFARLIQWWQDHPEHDRIQIFVVSDHSHVTQTRKVEVKSILRDAGFTVDTHLENGAEVAHNSCYGWSGNIRVRNSDLGLMNAVARAMVDHPAIGMIFSRDSDGVCGVVEGSFSQSLAQIAHPERTADLDYCLRDYDEPDPFGYAGTCWADNGQRINASNHGGLHCRVMQALLFCGGSAFLSGKEVSTPSGLIDVAPTALHLLGLSTSTTTGRVLTEAWSDAPPVVRPIHHQVGMGDYSQELLADIVNGTVYLASGRRIS